jgi:hypothetical protein
MTDKVDVFVVVALTSGFWLFVGLMVALFCVLNFEKWWNE